MSCSIINTVLISEFMQFTLLEIDIKHICYIQLISVCKLSFFKYKTDLLSATVVMIIEQCSA